MHVSADPEPDLSIKNAYIETACLYGEVIMHYFAHTLQRLINIRMYGVYAPRRTVM